MQYKVPKAILKDSQHMFANRKASSEVTFLSSLSQIATSIICFLTSLLQFLYAFSMQNLHLENDSMLFTSNTIKTADELLQYAFMIFQYDLISDFQEFFQSITSQLFLQNLHSVGIEPTLTAVNNGLNVTPQPLGQECTAKINCIYLCNISQFTFKYLKNKLILLRRADQKWSYPNYTTTSCKPSKKRFLLRSMASSKLCGKNTSILNKELDSDSKCLLCGKKMTAQHEIRCSRNAGIRTVRHDYMVNRILTKIDHHGHPRPVDKWQSSSVRQIGET
ncbi:Hypothetical_protein [Hexamita inflata]|uniref:Hypothetical_protein n=1 Tax=Hexamita inflata TaxID=28002 RepID=A0AA86RST5_9EUKA|nr:Hypothetical protein HINF_LOCUS66668 [Hexamita inflata]